MWAESPHSESVMSKFMECVPLILITRLIRTLVACIAAVLVISYVPLSITYILLKTSFQDILVFWLIIVINLVFLDSLLYTVKLGF